MIQHIVQDQFEHIHPCRAFDADGNRLSGDQLTWHAAYATNPADYVMIWITDSIEARYPLACADIHTIH